MPDPKPVQCHALSEPCRAWPPPGRSADDRHTATQQEITALSHAGCACADATTMIVNRQSATTIRPGGCTAVNTASRAGQLAAPGLPVARRDRGRRGSRRRREPAAPPKPARRRRRPAPTERGRTEPLWEIGVGRRRRLAARLSRGKPEPLARHRSALRDLSRRFSAGRRARHRARAVPRSAQCRVRSVGGRRVPGRFLRQSGARRHARSGHPVRDRPEADLQVSAARLRPGSRPLGRDPRGAVDRHRQLALPGLRGQSGADLARRALPGRRSQPGRGAQPAVRLRRPEPLFLSGEPALCPPGSARVRRRPRLHRHRAHARRVLVAVRAGAPVRRHRARLLQGLGQRGQPALSRQFHDRGRRRPARHRCFRASAACRAEADLVGPP